jgi:hypothetical protein
MKSFKQHILEKLKVSSKHNLPSIDSFCNRFLQYIHSETNTTIRFLDLPICKGKGFDMHKPETYDILPSYEFTGNESFLKMSDNRYIHIPEGIIYLICIDMFLEKDMFSEKDYYFSFHYILGDGYDTMDFSHPYDFCVNKEDLLDVISEDMYLEIYDYLEQYEKN